MWYKYKKYLGQTPPVRKLLREAFVKLAFYRAATLLLPFKYLTRSLQHHAEPTTPPPVTSKAQSEAVNIGDDVARAGRNTPWKSPCLAQVLTVQNMLAKRQIPGVFFLGARSQHATESSGAGLDAHAWLICGTEIINGVEGHEFFTVVSSWSWR